MKLTIESTDQLTQVDGVDVRIWKGRTEGGVECLVLVHRLAVDREADASQFEAELKRQLQPGVFTLRAIS